MATVFVAPESRVVVKVGLQRVKEELGEVQVKIASVMISFANEGNKQEVRD